MTDHTTEELEDLVRQHKFGEAAAAVNERYRLLSSRVLDVFEELLAALVEASFLGDLQDLRGALRLGKSSPRSTLSGFTVSKRMQNCLTAVLISLKKTVPADVRMGLRNVHGYFKNTEFSSTYGADIVHYEPEFSRLTDNRLIRLLSASSNTLDLGRLDPASLAKKKEVLEAYEKESLDPVRDTFLDTLAKCEDFFRLFAEHAADFRAFFDKFKKRGFVPDDDTHSEWLSLGDDYFHLELTKSTLMLPINPKALYWGMQKDYPVTLQKLNELKLMVTPLIEITESEERDNGLDLEFTCRNPATLGKEDITIEPSLRFTTAALERSVALTYRLIPVEPHRRWLLHLEEVPGEGLPSSLTLRVTCEASCYTEPFVVERTRELGGSRD
jgi:hypothetical protein